MTYIPHSRKPGWVICPDPGSHLVHDSCSESSAPTNWLEGALYFCPPYHHEKVEREREDVWVLCCSPTIEEIFLPSVFSFFVFREEARGWRQNPLRSYWSRTQISFPLIYLFCHNDCALTRFKAQFQACFTESVLVVRHRRKMSWGSLGPRVWADSKTGDRPLVQTEVEQAKGQRAWLKQKSSSGESVCSAHTALSCGLPFLGSSVNSLSLPLVAHTVLWVTFQGRIPPPSVSCDHLPPLSLLPSSPF